MRPSIDRDDTMRVMPPFYFLIVLIAMAVLHRFLPGYRWVDGPWRYLGLLPVAMGFAVVLYVAGLFRRRGTTIKPFQTSSALVTEGPFRFSRNPIYLGMAAALTGAAVVLGTITALLALPMFVWLITVLFIRKEEAMLTERFGDVYDAYRARVRRWL